MTGHLLQEPHHDGSPLYLSDEAPAPESEVVVRLRTDPGDPLEAVWIRTTYDAEPVYHACEVEHRDETTVWWAGRLPVHNPVTHYRFLLDGGGRQRTGSRRACSSRFRWAHVGDDTLAFLREHPEETLLVVARRAPGPPLDLPITVGETVVATADDPLTTGVTVYAV